MRAILDVLLVVLQMYSYVVIAAVVMSWLIAFNVINTRNEFVNMIVRIGLSAAPSRCWHRSAGACLILAGWTCRPSCCCSAFSSCRM